MKLILSALVATSLLGFDAVAQPAPPLPPNGAVPPPSANRPAVAPPPANSRPAMPPMMQRPGLGAPKAPPVMPDKDKLSYAIGFNIAGSIKRDQLEVDVDTIATAMKDVLAGRPTRLDEKEVREVMTQFQGAMRAKMAADREKQTAESKAKAEEYLAKNAKDPAVKTLPNGLQYKILKEGAGEMPKSTDSVTVAYKGSLIDGVVFDQKESFPTPVTGRTIKGWSEILPLMKVGSKWEVTIPPELGYGARGMPPKIGPNAVLIFEMELLSITAAPPAPAAPAGFHSSTSASPTSTTTPVVSGQIIKVPSKAELDRGAKIEVITNVPGSH